MTTKHYDVVHPETFGVLGTVNLNDGPREDVNGWWFMSYVSSHANGRKPQPSASAAVPQWAKKMGAKLV